MATFLMAFTRYFTKKQPGGDGTCFVSWFEGTQSITAKRYGGRNIRQLITLNPNAGVHPLLTYSLSGPSLSLMGMLSTTLRAMASQTHPEVCLRRLLGDSKTNQADSEDNHQSYSVLFFFNF